MPDISSGILDGRAVSDSPTAPLLIAEMVDALRPHVGLPNAFEAVAKRCALGARRVKAFYHQEIADWWISEDDAIRAAHDAWLSDHIRNMNARRDLLRARRAARKETHERVVDEVRGMAGAPAAHAE